MQDARSRRTQAIPRRVRGDDKGLKSAKAFFDPPGDHSKAFR
jgi:CHASE1-domain containing sensor protein